jgi:hypothetical protein
VNALTSVTELLAGGTLVFYSGTQPVNSETGLSGNTPLATFTFSTPAFGASNVNPGSPTSGGSSPGFEQQTASFVASSVAPSNNGTVVWARATMATTAWAINTAYTAGKIVTANSNLYYCLKGGTSAGSGSGPSATTSPVVDNASSASQVVWQYLGPATATVVADFTVGTSGTDIIIGNTTLSTTINVSITSFILQIPSL